MRYLVLLLIVLLLDAYGVKAALAAEQHDSELLFAVLNSRCSACHNSDDAAGDFDLTALKSVITHNENIATANLTKSLARVFGVMVTHQMPPVDTEPITRRERGQVISYLREKLQGSGLIDEWQHKLLFPEYGNYIDHETLFDGSVTSVAWSPSRLWKKSPYIFDSLASRGIGFRPGRYGQRSSHLAKLKQPFTIEDKAGVRDFAAITMADSATLGTLIRNGEALVDKHLAGALHELRIRVDGPIPEEELPKDKKGKPIKLRFPATPEDFARIVLSDTAPSDEQIRLAIERMFQLVIERSPTDEEVIKYRKLMKLCIDEGGKLEGLRMMLIAITVSPPAVFRTELGQGTTDRHGRHLLSGAELAFAISYALTDQKPDEALFLTAANGRLKTRADVAREVTRYWDDDTIEKPRVLRFFHEFFGYAAAPGVFKDTERFGKDYRKVPERLVEDADTLVRHIVRQDQNVLAELLTTERYFVSHSGDNEAEREIHDALQNFYDYYKDKPWKEFPYKVPDEHMKYVRSLHQMFTHANGNVTKRWMKYLEQCDKADISHMPLGGARSSGRDYIATYDLDERTFSFPVEQPFALAPKQRIGILMHPAWLIAHSLNLDNDPIRRGKWIRERLLADTVPELPITIDATIPEDHTKSLRERLAVTREQECWRCHVKMNPLGMPFELYDDFGRYRKGEELTADGSALPVDSMGSLIGTDDAELDGGVSDPLELMHRLAKSERVRQAFVRHAFRYWMGRNEMLSDSKTLIAADRAYVNSGGSFRALVISLLTSDSFLYRKAEAMQDNTMQHSAKN